MSKLMDYLDRLPTEFKVGMYWAASVLAVDVASYLLGTEQIPWDQLMRVFAANILLVFAGKAPGRIKKIRG